MDEGAGEGSVLLDGAAVGSATRVVGGASLIETELETVSDDTVEGSGGGVIELGAASAVGAGEIDSSEEDGASEDGAGSAEATGDGTGDSEAGDEVGSGAGGMLELSLVPAVTPTERIGSELARVEVGTTDSA